MKKITTNSEKETFELAKKYASHLKRGIVIGLIGELGSGKTVFAKGLGAGLGIKANINSPTFNIMKVYKVTSQNKKVVLNYFCHIDAYRLRGGLDLIAVGAEEYFNRPDVIVLIEWADKVAGILPKNSTLVKFDQKPNNKRVIIFS